MELKNLLTAYCISLILTCLKYLRVWVQYRGDIRYEYSIPRCISQRGESGSAKSAGSQTPNSQSARLTPCCITERWVLFFANISAKKKIICNLKKLLGQLIENKWFWPQVAALLSILRFYTQTQWMNPAVPWWHSIEQPQIQPGTAVSGHLEAFNEPLPSPNLLTSTCLNFVIKSS